MHSMQCSVEVNIEHRPEYAQSSALFSGLSKANDETTCSWLPPYPQFALHFSFQRCGYRPSLGLCRPSRVPSSPTLYRPVLHSMYLCHLSVSFLTTKLTSTSLSGSLTSVGNHHHHRHTTIFHVPFSRTTQVSRCQKRTSAGLYGARQD